MHATDPALNPTRTGDAPEDTRTLVLRELWTRLYTARRLLSDAAEITDHRRKREAMMRVNQRIRNLEALIAKTEARS